MLCSILLFHKKILIQKYEGRNKFFITCLCLERSERNGKNYENRKKSIKAWNIIACIIPILFFIQIATQLNFINEQYNFYAKIILLIIFFVSLNKSLFKNTNNLKITSIIICIVVISLISLNHIFFEDLTYISEIELNNDRDLIVKEQGVLGEYNIYFYEKKLFLFKKPLSNSKYLVTHGAPFSSGEYEIKYNKDNKILIKYRNPRGEYIEEYQEVTIQY